MKQKSRHLQADTAPPDLPELELWRAVLVQMIEDARTYAATRKDPGGYRQAAYRDLIERGPMLRRLSGFALVDPELVHAAFVRSLASHRPLKPTE